MIFARAIRLACVVVAALSLTAAKAAAQNQVVFERTGYRLTSIGSHVSVSARVYDARRRAVPNAPIAWRVADSAIATVTGQGVVVSRRVGQTRVWAVSGGDSASALILVDQWAAKFAFTPAVLRFEAIGARNPIRIQVHDAAGQAIADAARRTSSCRSLDDRVATLASITEVRAVGNGVTYIRCADRGIADSVRVEVRQRAVRAAITDKGSFASFAVGDTIRMRLRAFDRSGDEITEARPTWASLSPSVVSVDPLSGLARPLSGGEAKIVAQVGDATDTVSFQVRSSGSLLAPATPAADAIVAVSDAPRGPALLLTPLIIFEGESGTLVVSGRDASGNEMPNASRDVVLQSTDTSVATTGARLSVAGRQQGSAYIVARLGTMTDSALVTVRSRSAVASVGLAGTATAAFERPRYNLDSARASNEEQLKQAMDEIRSSSAIRIPTGRFASFTGLVGMASHASQLPSGVTEVRSGLILGGTAHLAPYRMLKLSADFHLGTLKAPEDGRGEDLTRTEAEGTLTFSPAPWFGFAGGYVVRSQQTETATQQWKFVRVSALLRFPFVGGAINSVTMFSALPEATVSGEAGKADLTKSFSAESGVEFNPGPFNVVLTYYMENFVNPDAGRTDQFSMLRLRLGFQKRQLRAK